MNMCRTYSKLYVHLVFKAADIRISDLVQQIKANSSRFINEKRWNKQRFAWQEGFGAFSYSESMKGIIINYIHKQKEHHKKIDFKAEYVKILERFGNDTSPRRIE